MKFFTGTSDEDDNQYAVLPTLVYEERLNHRYLLLGWWKWFVGLEWER